MTMQHSISTHVVTLLETRLISITYRGLIEKRDRLYSLEVVLHLQNTGIMDHLAWSHNGKARK